MKAVCLRLGGAARPSLLTGETVLKLRLAPHRAPLLEYALAHSPSSPLALCSLQSLTKSGYQPANAPGGPCLGPPPFSRPCRYFILLPRFIDDVPDVKARISGSTSFTPTEHVGLDYCQILMRVARFPIVPAGAILRQPPWCGR